MDVRKPLTQKIKVKMRGGDKDFFEVKYEKPTLFCFCCGRMGHGLKDCMDYGEEKELNVKYGGWLKVSPWKKVSLEMDRGRKLYHGSCAKELFIY